MIAIIVPSRGLIFTKTLEFIEKQRREFPQEIKVYFTHDLPIPECFNSPTELAYQDPQSDIFWFIEEDVVPPENAMEKMLQALKDADVAAIDYGFNGGHNCIVRSSSSNNILFTGFGCTMVKRHVFDHLDKPWFRADRMFNISMHQWMPVDPHKVYGQFDIDFGTRVLEKGFRIVQVDGECEHLQLNALGQKEINNGMHQIGEKGRIDKTLSIPLEHL